MNDLVIRLAVVDDIKAVAEMESSCFSDPWSADYFEHLFKNPSVHFLIVLNGETPIGYGIITIIFDECEILNIAVMPEYRQCGIGRKLMNNIIDICRTSRVASVFLEHRESNIPAASLYESLGFTEYGRRRKYYSDPAEDAILRKLTL